MLRCCGANIEGWAHMTAADAAVARVAAAKEARVPKDIYPERSKGSDRPGGPDQPFKSGTVHNAPAAIGRILDKPPQLAEQVLRDDTRLTRRWGHGDLHDHLPAMNGHVIMAYDGAAQDIQWR